MAVSHAGTISAQKEKLRNPLGVPLPTSPVANSYLFPRSSSIGHRSTKNRMPSLSRLALPLLMSTTGSTALHKQGVPQGMTLSGDEFRFLRNGSEINASNQSSSSSSSHSSHRSSSRSNGTQGGGSNAGKLTRISLNNGSAFGGSGSNACEGSTNGNAGFRYANDCNSTSGPFDGPVRQELTSLEGMVLTGKVQISNQVVDAIMDTGSFEFIVFNRNCNECEDIEKTSFDPLHADADFHWGSLTATQTYGSGRTISKEAYAQVSIRESDTSEPLQATNQLIWLAEDIIMGFKLTGGFGGIFGLGPPPSAIHFSQVELEMATSIRSSGFNEGQTLEAELRNLVALENHTSRWLTSTQTSIFSICLSLNRGGNGWIIYNDVDVAAMHTEQDWIPSSGDYWQVPGKDFRIGHIPIDKSCIAVMDSGTSLIGMPRDALDQLEVVVRDLIFEQGCDDVSNWPDFEFDLGGQHIRLPPTSYVTMFNSTAFDDEFGLLESRPSAFEQIKGVRSAIAMPTEFRHHVVTTLMPHLGRFRSSTHAKLNSTTAGGDDVFCAPGVFADDSAVVDGHLQCQFLFGVPFFREYYTSHRFHDNRRSMLFTKSDRECTLAPSQSKLKRTLGPLRVTTAVADSRHRRILRRERRQAKATPQIVNPNKLRFPSGTVRKIHRDWMLAKEKR